MERETQYAIGIDIGSTCAKTVVMEPLKNIVWKQVVPTGWSSKDTAEAVRESLLQQGIDAEKSACVATGYGRVSVEYADKHITEITCHARGAAYLFGEGSLRIIDIGGQDTKVISVQDGAVLNFIMNDKCSAGTGRFLEIMANMLGLSPNELIELARGGKDTSISSMCTVFAESEVISLIGRGTPRENISFAVVDSVVKKVASQYSKLSGMGDTYLTGGFCESRYLLDALSKEIGVKVTSDPLARYAGAIGAALSAVKLQQGNKIEKE